MGGKAMLILLEVLALGCQHTPGIIGEGARGKLEESKARVEHLVRLSDVLR